MKKINAALRDSEGLLDLLEHILASYQDSDSRPEASLSLYRRCLQLSRNHRVRLAKRFVVVEGGARRKRRTPLLQWRFRRHLKLAPRPGSLAASP